MIYEFYILSIRPRENIYYTTLFSCRAFFFLAVIIIPLIVLSSQTAFSSPVADFATNPSSGNRPLLVNFTDTSTGVVDTWEWDFDNDTVTDSTEQNPTFRYELPGNYTVTLTVSGSEGTDSETKTDHILVTDDILLAWNPYTENDIIGYRLFCRKQGEDYNYDLPIWEGNDTKCTVSNLEDNAIYFFVVRASDIYGNESSDSNEIILLHHYSGNHRFLDSLSITGPDWVFEGDTVTYMLTAQYTDGSSQTITDGANWSTDSSYASISPGWNITTSSVPGTQVVNFTTSYTEDAVNFETAVLKVIIVDNEEGFDSDADGVPDWWEATFDLDPFYDDSLMDLDEDFLFNLDEYRNGTNPDKKDTDSDGLQDGLEVTYGYDPNDPNSQPRFPLMEIGEVVVNHKWEFVTFHEPFLDPIVVAKSLSHNGKQPAIVRIDNVSESSFDVRVQEWTYQDGRHKKETVNYLVVERGSYTLPNGTRVEANRFNTKYTHPFVQVMFNEPFQSIPVVVATVSTYNDAIPVTGRLRHIDMNGFEFTLQEQEPADGYHGIETVSFVAWEEFSGNVDGIYFEVYNTDDVVTHLPYKILFDQAFAAPPAFLADIQTAHGLNTASLRWQNRDPFGIEVLIEEERSYDKEIRHTTEVVGYMVFCDGTMSDSNCLP